MRSLTPKQTAMVATTFIFTIVGAIVLALIFRHLNKRRELRHG